MPDAPVMPHAVAMPDATLVPAAWQHAQFAAEPWRYELATAWRLLGPGCRLRPALGLDFPPGEIVAAETAADGTWTVTVGLAGLYGNGSPLPLADTEELLAEGDDSLPRGFIDLLGDRLLHLEAEALDQTRIATAQAQRLALVSGLQARAIGAGIVSDDLLAYAGLFAGRSRSAAGLARMLSHWHGVACAVEPCLALWTPIPDAERSRAGAVRLGIDAVAGTAICSRATSFGITVGPLPWTAAGDWLPGGRCLAELCALTELMNRDALVFEVRLLVERQPMPSLGLGIGRLGLDQRLTGTVGPLTSELVFRSN